jgi:hypothetical protein
MPQQNNFRVNAELAFDGLYEKADFTPQNVKGLVIAFTATTIGTSLAVQPLGCSRAAVESPKTHTETVDGFAVGDGCRSGNI